MKRDELINAFAEIDCNGVCDDGYDSDDYEESGCRAKKAIEIGIIVVLLTGGLLATLGITGACLLNDAMLRVLSKMLIPGVAAAAIGAAIAYIGWTALIFQRTAESLRDGDPLCCAIASVSGWAALTLLLTGAAAIFAYLFSEYAIHTWRLGISLAIVGGWVLLIWVISSIREDLYQ